MNNKAYLSPELLNEFKEAINKLGLDLSEIAETIGVRNCYMSSLFQGNFTQISPIVYEHILKYIERSQNEKPKPKPLKVQFNPIPKNTMIPRIGAEKIGRASCRERV